MKSDTDNTLIKVELANFEHQLPENSLINASQTDQVVVVFQGHINVGDKAYTADSLVVLYLESDDFSDFYQQLSGKFWLLLIDKKTQQTVLVNDPLGIQQCYYCLEEGSLLVSSSLRSLKRAVKTPFTLSNQAIFNYIYFHCIPAPITIYREAYKVEVSKAIAFDSLGNEKKDILYRPHFNQQEGNAVQQQQDCLSEIEQAVKSNITDNCGAFLSGGLDSSTVAGMLAKNADNAKTFSIGFNIDGYDETPYAQLTAKHFNTQHEVLYLQPEQAVEEFIKVACYFEEPFGNSSAMAAYFCAKFAKGKGVTTLLAGDGGDELFAGNSRYAKQKTFELYNNVPGWIKAALDGVVNNNSIGSLPGFKKAKSYINQAEMKLPERLQSYNFVNQLGLKNIFSEDFLVSVDPDLPVKQLQSRYFACDSEDTVDKMLYLDWKFTLADNDLVKVNKMCELAGVSVRYPLLEKNVVDFSCTVSANEKLPGDKLRHFYKESCRGFLADETLTKSKHGFGLPFGMWMKENEELKSIALDNLHAFKQRAIIKNSLIDNAIKAHESSHAGYYGELIWIIVVLEIWLQNEEASNA